MSIRPFRDIKRRKTKKITVGNVEVGGDSPISVQSMTNTLTTDIDGTIRQINELSDSGADIVRVSCPDEASSLSIKKIIKHVNVPIVADIHFHYKRAIEAAKSGASCLRINPGNIGSRDRVREILKAAKDNNCSIRIGVNAGSLEKNLLEKYKDPCPNVVIEAMACGLLTIGSNSGGVPELVGECGIVLPVAESWDQMMYPTVTEVCEAIVKATESLIARQYAARDRAIAEFSHDKWIAKHDELFKCLLFA